MQLLGITIHNSKGKVAGSRQVFEITGRLSYDNAIKTMESKFTSKNKWIEFDYPEGDSNSADNMKSLVELNK